MPVTKQNWIPLVNYSMKYGISLSTLRRRIKANTVPFKLDNGKYLILDENVESDESESSAVTNQNKKASAQPTSAPIPAKNHGAEEGVFCSTPSSAPGLYQESILTTANRIIEELKGAYSKILAQQEEQISLLKEEIADLRTLTRVLEDQLYNNTRPQHVSTEAIHELPANLSQEESEAFDELDELSSWESGADTGPSLSDRYNQAIAQRSSAESLFSHSVNERQQSRPAAATSASQSPIVGHDEEFFFDREDETSANQGNGRPERAEHSTPEIDLSNIKIPNDFRLDFDF